MDIAVIGSGYVGLVAGSCFAEQGNEVICVDNNAQKVAALRSGKIPIYEPGLTELITKNVEEKRLTFTIDIALAIEKAAVIFIAVGTPQDEDGSADLTHVLAVARAIGTHMNGFKVIVDKSTVPVGTAEKVRAEIKKHTSHPFSVVSNPEFLKEGAALDDFLKPDRVVIGVDDEKSARIMKDLYAPFVRTDNPIIVMDVASAEMTKYAANAMLATRISFMNEIATLCDAVDADIDQVRRGIGTDRRIGPSFLFPGIGYGGSCFPKDVQALIRTGKDSGLQLKISEAVERVNHRQKSFLIQKIKNVFPQVAGKKIAIWGLAFKPRTDDVREAPALVVVRSLLDLGASVVCFDPEAQETFAAKFGIHPNLSYGPDAYETLRGADALCLVTEWNEFRRPSFSRMRELMASPVIFDGRNIYDPTLLVEEGFSYHSVGRKSVNPATKG